MFEEKIAGIILAGGKSKRMQKNKAFLQVGNLSIIERIKRELQEVCAELLIVTNSPEDYTQFGIRIVVDIIPKQGPLSGIHAGLVNSSYDYNLVVACDMPFVSHTLATYLFKLAPGFDAVIPLIKGLPQPLFAVYSKTCINPIENCLKAKIRKMRDFYQYINALWVDEERLRGLVNLEEVFLNVNTPQDWEEAKNKVEQKGIKT